MVSVCWTRERGRVWEMTRSGLSRDVLANGKGRFGIAVEREGSNEQEL